VSTHLRRAVTYVLSYNDFYGDAHHQDYTKYGKATTSSADPRRPNLKGRRDLIGWQEDSIRDTTTMALQFGILECSLTAEILLLGMSRLRPFSVSSVVGLADKADLDLTSS